MTLRSSPTMRDLAEILWLPLVIAAITAAVTWLIWYYTSATCTSHAAVLHHCNPSLVARYIDVEIWAVCLTLGALAGGLVGGGVNYTMFSKERAARIAAETLLAEERRLRGERIEEERRIRDQLLEEDRKRIDELVANQNSLIMQIAESQRQSAETQQALLATITALTAELTELRRQRNGANGH